MLYMKDNQDNISDFDLNNNTTRVAQSNVFR